MGRDGRQQKKKIVEEEKQNLYAFFGYRYDITVKQKRHPAGANQVLLP